MVKTMKFNPGVAFTRSFALAVFQFALRLAVSLFVVVSGAAFFFIFSAESGATVGGLRETLHSDAVWNIFYTLAVMASYVWWIFIPPKWVAHK